MLHDLNTVCSLLFTVVLSERVNNGNGIDLRRCFGRVHNDKNFEFRVYFDGVALAEIKNNSLLEDVYSYKTISLTVGMS